MLNNKMIYRIYQIIHCTYQYSPLAAGLNNFLNSIHQNPAVATVCEECNHSQPKLFHFTKMVGILHIPLAILYSSDVAT